jgi:hypothetical protein
MDSILKMRKDGKVDTLYHSTCPTCLKDKGYVRKSRVNLLCLQCSGKNIGSSNLGKVGPNKGKTFSEETRQKMSSSKKNQIPWNKNKIGVSEETRKKMSNKKLGHAPSNLNQSMTLEQKVKLSCINQGITIDEFQGFITPINRIERSEFYGRNLHIQCFEKYNYTCDKCQTRGTSLNAHHMNSWAFFEDERFDLLNLVCLCNECHKKFHSIYGNGKAQPNTKLQYNDFKLSSKKELTILTGAPASGKSWVVNQLSNYDVVDSDIHPKKDLVKLCEAVSKPILTLTVGVSTFMKRNPQFSFKLVVIQETQQAIEQRMLSRGGKITSTIERRIKRMLSLSKQAIFSGTAKEALDFLQT